MWLAMEMVTSVSFPCCGSSAGAEESVGFAGDSDESLSLPTRCAPGSWWIQ